MHVNDFAHGYDAAARDDEPEFKRLDAEIKRLRGALEGIASLSGKTLLGPGYDTEHLHAQGAAAAFEQAAELARAALEG